MPNRQRQRNNGAEQPRGRGGRGRNLSQEDRFWRMARRMLNQGYMSPWQQMQANDGQEAAEKASDDYYDFMEDQVPGQGQYVGDYAAPQGAPPGPESAYGGLGGQLSQMPAQGGMEGFFPPVTEDPNAPYGPGTEAFTQMQAGAQPGSPTYKGMEPAAAPVSYNGAPQDAVAYAQKYGEQYGVDPGVLLAIAKQETQFGEAGLGRKGLDLGYGAFDSGASYKWQGRENQYRHGAAKLAEWGVKGIDDITGGKAASWATDPNWEKGVANAYAGLAPQLQPGSQPGQLGLIEQTLKGIEEGRIDPKVLDTIDKGLAGITGNFDKWAAEDAAKTNPTTNPTTTPSPDEDDEDEDDED